MTDPKGTWKRVLINLMIVAGLIAAYVFYIKLDA